MSSKTCSKKEKSAYNKYLDFYEACINEDEEFREWERSQDFTESKKLNEETPDFFSINGRKL